ncbi:MAG: hypothetical protein JWO24_3244 [Rhodospirillales bacterium]|jgi:ribosomal protein S18 acetylase RimI-like enzyme|nr:hypothetical protein [Rhodospirillales bacterium]
MTCRAARPEDAPALLPLVRAMNADQGDRTELVDAAALLAAPGTMTMLAERDGALVGYATAHPTFETGHAERGFYVGDLFVDPAHRRQGVARGLLAALAAAGLAQGAKHFWLTAKEDNFAAHALYRRLGGHGEPVLAFACVEGHFQALADEAAT